MSETVKVALRCRPMSKDEKNASLSTVVTINDSRNEIFLNNPKNAQTKQFTFDHAYSQKSSQNDIYQDCAYRIIESVLEGYNGTIFAYGQTGTGKTYTMEGDKNCEENKGIIPRTFEQIFNTIDGTSETQFLVSCTMLELYNEDVFDLLMDKGKNKLSVGQKVDTGFFVKDLSTHDMKSAKECLELLNKGSLNRKKAETQMNKDSSRSHSIFSIIIETSVMDEQGNQMIKKGKLNLVDLAGSERQSKTKATGMQLEEAKKINLSLVCLGKVISSLTQRASHIPYRDSKLTKLLMDSLGGNTKTIMIANVGPACKNYDETLNTIRYANQAKNIKNKPKINEDPKDAKLNKIKQEIAELKEYLKNAMGGNVSKEILNGELTETIKSQVLKQMAKQKEQGEEKNREKIEKIMHMKQITEQERKKLLEEVKRHEEQENKEREEKQKMLEKISAAKNKILKGQKNKEEFMKVQKELQKKREENERIMRQKQKLKQEAEDAEVEKGILEKKYASIKEEFKEKEILLSKIKKRYAVVKNDNDEYVEETSVQLKNLTEENQELENTINLYNLIVESYFDTETLEKINSAIVYRQFSDDFGFDENCEEEIKTMYNTFVNIKFIQEKDCREVDPLEENFLLFGDENPFSEFKC